MKTYEVRVKNINDEIVTMAIEEESLSAAQSKCREIALEVLDDNNKNCEISSDNNESMHVNRNTNKYLIITIVSIGIILGVLLNISSALTRDRIVGLVAFATDERKCFNYYKDDDYFKDPDSAYIDSSTILTKKNDKEELKLYYPHILDKKSSFNSIIEVNVFAKNSMGGYVSDKIECPLGDKYNLFDDMEIKMATYHIEKYAYQHKTRKH